MFRRERHVCPPWFAGGRSAADGIATDSRNITGDDLDGQVRSARRRRRGGRLTMTWSSAEGLEGAVVLVTGAAGGIGRSVAEAFAAAGARVCALDVDPRRRRRRRRACPATATRPCERPARHHRPRRRDRWDRRTPWPPRPPGPRRRRAAPAQRHRRDHRGRLGLPGRHQPQGVVLPDASRRPGRSARRAAGASRRSPRRDG